MIYRVYVFHIETVAQFDDSGRDFVKIDIFFSTVFVWRNKESKKI